MEQTNDMKFLSVKRQFVPQRPQMKCAVCGAPKTENLSMHKLPRNEKTKNLWFKAVGKKLTSGLRICSNHFKQSDYRSGDTRHYLKSGAIPSQFDKNVTGAQNHAFSKTTNGLGSLSGNEQIAVTNPENNLSLQKCIDNNSEDEVCYIYYLDEEQNVVAFQSSISESNEMIITLNADISQETSVSQMDFDTTQSIISSPCTELTEEESLMIHNTELKTLLQNFSLEPNTGLNVSDFATEHACQTFCDIISEYRGQIYDLQNLNNVLQTEINCLNELSNMHFNI